MHAMHAWLDTSTVSKEFRCSPSPGEQPSQSLGAGHKKRPQRRGPGHGGAPRYPTKHRKYEDSVQGAVLLLVHSLVRSSRARAHL